MRDKRYLVITADDFGIGPETTRGILDLARDGKVTASVLLVNSPYAEEAVRKWRQAGAKLELGWHVCLTLDKPVLPPHKVPSLVDDQGRFFPLGKFLKKIFLGQLHPSEIQLELEAQHQRFQELLGFSPSLVNGHHHIHIMPLVGKILLDVLKKQQFLPYLRRVVEPWNLLAKVSGARTKRLFLSTLGKLRAQQQSTTDFPGNDVLTGLSNPKKADDWNYFSRWLSHAPGKIVELMCHPGYSDHTLTGRDGKTDADLNYRFLELQRLQESAFAEAVHRAGFTLIAPNELSAMHRERKRDAA